MSNTLLTLVILVVGKTLPLISELKNLSGMLLIAFESGSCSPCRFWIWLNCIFNNYGSGSNHNAGLRYYDDITYENGSAIVAADASLVPATAAPTPTHGSLNTDPNADAADVFNIFSDHYPNSILWCPDNEARAGWSAGGATKPYSVNGEGTDAIVMQDNLEYIGSYWNGGGSNKLGQIDLSNYSNVNIDIHFQELTGTDHVLGIALLVEPASEEALISYPIAAGAAGWRTITLDLSQYGGLDKVNGIKIEGMIPAGGTRWTLIFLG